MCQGKVTAMLRGRREERQEERQTFGRGGDAVHYQMRQKLVSIGDDFWIETDRGERAFKVDGKALRVRQTLSSRTPPGKSCARSRSACCGSRTAWRSRAPAASGWRWSRRR